MQRVFYAGGSFLTSDQIAEALFDYAAALATSPLADVVHVPIVDERSTRQSVATLLIGPASQLMSMAADIDGLVDPIDTETVEELERRALLVGASRPVPEALREGVAPSNDYEV
ncbi:hypothetical protein QT381_14405 [Galbitalea sp. SE-J8]|uniref:hypothetical protein n=1 Tax=Galbitalea sp. SE-J8 TaxID=3054952 RepID=UPI00259D27AB|nr:hypothetical protein [Galbitalea sp. SE-J8]MDM4764197.1 hypothetical protein [Galbitalea sp. SE-J8]